MRLFISCSLVPLVLNKDVEVSSAPSSQARNTGDTFLNELEQAMETCINLREFYCVVSVSNRIFPAVLKHQALQGLTLSSNSLESSDLLSIGVFRHLKSLSLLRISSKTIIAFPLLASALPESLVSLSLSVCASLSLY